MKHVYQLYGKVFLVSQRLQKNPNSSALLNYSDMHATFSVSHFYIIESLGPDEIKTGKQLHQEVFTFNHYRSGLQAGYVAVLGKAEFFQTLRLIAEEAQTKGRKPFIHFEIHGSPDGLQLSNGEFVTWKELSPALVAINEVTKNHLFITLATCYGIHLSKTCDILQRAPFAWFIGPASVVSAVEVYTDYTVFFDTLVQSKDVVIALNAMNDQNDRQPYGLFSAAEFYREVLATWISDNSAKMAREAKIKGLIARARAMGNRNPYDALWKETEKNVRLIPVLSENMLDYFLFRSDIKPQL